MTDPGDSYDWTLTAEPKWPFIRACQPLWIIAID